VTFCRNQLVPTDSDYIACKATDETFTLPIGLVLRSVGYRGVPLSGVPFNERRGIISNVDGRVTEVDSGDVKAGEYVAGWIKRGPSGVIGTNKADATATVKLMLEDVAGLTPAAGDLADPTSVDTLLASRNTQVVDFDAWLRVENFEVTRGKEQGRPRVKVTRIDEMLAHAQG